MKDFFARSEYLDHEVLRPLSHVYSNWELTWLVGDDKYLEEDHSCAKKLNELIEEFGTVVPPARYHDNEDRLAEFTRGHLKWPIKKSGARWVGADYHSIIEQGGFHDIDQQELILAAAGRIRAAIARDQHHYDEMEESHRQMLGAVLAIIIYHRT